VTKPLIPPPIQGLIAALAIWLIAKYFPEFNLETPFQKAAAILIALIGLSIDFICAFLFIKTKTTISPINPSNTSTLVTTGLYKISRNPMYLGLLLLLTGWSLWQGNPISLLVILIFITSITLTQIKPEESALEEKFGQDYRDYKNQVRRWI